MSAIISGIFALIVSAALVWILQGTGAMSKHLTEATVVGVLALIGELLIVWGPLYMRHVASVTYSDHQQLVQKNKELVASNSSSQLVDPHTRDEEIRKLQQEVRDYKNAQPTQQITTLRFSRVNVEPSKDLLTYVALTNKPVSPINATFHCPMKFQFIAAGGTAGGPVPVMAGVGNVSDNDAEFSSSLVWDKNNPIIITTLIPKGGEVWGCTLKLN